MIFLCESRNSLQFYKALFIDLSQWSQNNKHYMSSQQSFENHRAFLRNLMRNQPQNQGLSQQEIEKIINQRIKKFYVTDDYIEVDRQHFKPRIQPLYLSGVVPTNDTLVLFGIDFMNKTQLNSYFGMFEPHYCNIDQSNCIIRFPSAEHALAAIRRNLREDSNTRYKIEEYDEGEEVGLQLNMPKTQPKEWIELRPYTYRYGKSKFTVKDYQRKLYVRYATNKEMQMGFDKPSFIEGLINRCKMLWQNQARKDEQMRKFLQEKVKLYRQKLNILNQRAQKSHRQRSRSRDKFKAGNNSLHEVSLEVRSRQQHTEELSFSELARQFQEMNVGGDISIINNSSAQRRQNETGLSGAPEVSYRVVQPAQMKLQFKHSQFDYRRYVQQSIQRSEKKKRVATVDLTDD